MKKKKIVFVCTGNTCRSPLAEALCLQKLDGRADIEVSSAGVSASGGSPASAESVSLAKKYGGSLAEFRSTAVDRKLLEQATHVFAMTRAHLGILESRFPDYADKNYLVCEFTDIEGLGFGSDIPDPIGMGKAAYEEVADRLNKALPDVIAYIDQTSK